MNHLTRASAVTLFAATAVSAQSHLAKPVIDTLDHHIVRVMNPGPTAWTDTNGWKLVYERTVQPAEGSPGMITNPQEVLLLNDGRLILLQHDPVSIMLYDAQGNFVRTLGRHGAGPAEYRLPTMALYRDTLVIQDASLGRVVMLSLDGKEVREFLTDVHDDGPAISVDTHGRIRIENSRRSVSVFQPQWIHFSANGTKLDSLIPPTALTPKSWQTKITGGQMSVNVPFAPQNAYAFASDGSVIYGGQDRYELIVSRNGHDTTRMFGRSGLRPDPIPTRLRDSIVTMYAKRGQLDGVMHESDVPHAFILWNEISIDGRGDIWVERGRKSMGTLALDVFDPAGRFLGSVPPPFSSFWRTSWGGDRIAVVDTDDNDLPRVRIFRIDRRGH